MSTDYKRNLAAIVSVLKSTNRVCEDCHNLVPFNLLSDGTLYLELHHIFSLGEGGDE